MVETRGSSCLKVKNYERGGRVAGKVKQHDRSRKNKVCYKAKMPEKKRRGHAYKSSNVSGKS